MPFQPVPTYADPVLVEEESGSKKSVFNPVWLSWFLTLSQGGISATVVHNLAQGLQGGAANEFYHLSLTQYTNMNIRDLSAPAAIAVGGSPFTFHNTHSFDIDVIVTNAGGVTNVDFSRDNSTFYDVGFVSGIVRLSPGDYLRVTYGVAPTMTEIPR